MKAYLNLFAVITLFSGTISAQVDSNSRFIDSQDKVEKELSVPDQIIVPTPPEAIPAKPVNANQAPKAKDQNIRTNGGSPAPVKSDKAKDQNIRTNGSSPAPVKSDKAKDQNIRKSEKGSSKTTAVPPTKPAVAPPDKGQSPK